MRNYDRTGDAFQYADELVKFIKEYPNHPDTRGFGVGVAGFPEGHPGMPNRVKEMEFLKKKVDAGSDYVCTQLFFDNRDFYDFRERCELAGIHVPIIAGIMPIERKSSMLRMADLALGARYPRDCCGQSTVARGMTFQVSGFTGPPSSVAISSTTVFAASTITH